MPLSRKGISQIKKLKLKADYVYSSPLRRCMQTANILLGKRHIPIEISNDLIEIDFGEWEGLTLNQMKKRNPRKFKSWLYNFIPPRENPGDGSAFGMSPRRGATTASAATGVNQWGSTNFKMPNGESVKDMVRRVNRFWNYVIKKHRGCNVLIVTHGGPAKIIVMRALGLPMEYFWRITIDTGGVWEILR